MSTKATTSILLLKCRKFYGIGPFTNSRFCRFEKGQILALLVSQITTNVKYYSQLHTIQIDEQKNIHI